MALTSLIPPIHICTTTSTSVSFFSPTQRPRATSTQATCGHGTRRPSHHHSSHAPCPQPAWGMVAGCTSPPNTVAPQCPGQSGTGECQSNTLQRVTHERRVNLFWVCHLFLWFFLFPPLWFLFCFSLCDFSSHFKLLKLRYPQERKSWTALSLIICCHFLCRFLIFF